MQHTRPERQPTSVKRVQLRLQVTALCQEYNALARRLEEDAILEKLKSVNAECETFKANMQNLTRERTIAREKWLRGEETLKRVEVRRHLMAEETAFNGAQRARTHPH